MLFNFAGFIAEARSNAKNKEVIDKYESCYGPIGDDIKKQVWFIDYVSKFLPYYEAANCPPELEDEFDWQILFSLIVSSFASEFELVKPDKLISDPNQKVDINIYVRDKSGEQVKRSLDELWSFQILRLYEIYCLEQIGLQSIIADNENEMIGIYRHRIEKIEFIKNYNSTFKKISSNQKKKTDDGYIYHYTTFKTINEIIKSNSLRACDLKRLNDRMEHKIWFDVFDQVVEKFKIKADADNYLVFLGKIIEQINSYKKYDCYVTCFSKQRDLLSQWRAYGDDGQGIAIAFEAKELLGYLYEHNDSQSEFRLLNGFLEYDSSKVFSDISTSIGKMLVEFCSAQLPLEDFLSPLENLNSFEEKIQRIFMRMQDLKDDSFIEEKEFRLFWMQEKNNQIKPVSSFERNQRLIPFVDLSFGNKKIPIKEIILGPALSDKDEKRENIIDVLQCYGYNTEAVVISESRLPYRN